MTSAFPAAREWGQNNDPLESRSTPQEEIARCGAAGQAKAIEDMCRLRRKARGEEMKAQEMLSHTDEDREYAVDLLGDLDIKAVGPQLEITTQWFCKARVETALRLAAQADAPQSPAVPWKGNLSVDLRRGTLSVSADGITLIDEAGVCWAIVFPDKKGLYDHAAIIAGALAHSRPDRKCK
jgi:hypothetical protein